MAQKQGSLLVLFEDGVLSTANLKDKAGRCRRNSILEFNHNNREGQCFCKSKS